jgi:hypothetical protein
MILANSLEDAAAGTLEAVGMISVVAAAAAVLLMILVPLPDCGFCRFPVPRWRDDLEIQKLCFGVRFDCEPRSDGQRHFSDYLFGNLNCAVGAKIREVEISHVLFPFPIQLSMCVGRFGSVNRIRRFDSQFQAKTGSHGYSR